MFPFFSRQIGLLSGQEVPLDAGIKLTGTIGRTDVGVLNVRTGDLPVADEKNYFVARVKRNLFEVFEIAPILALARWASGPLPARGVRERTFRYGKTALIHG